MNRTLLAVALVAFATPIWAGLAPGAAFEVASVRASPPPETTPTLSVGPQPGGRWVARNATVLWLVRAAYPEFDREGQISGGPEWAYRTRFDIEAKADSAAATDDELRLMARRLLRDRFALRFHVERRPLDVYVVTLAREDGRLGPGLSPPAVDCQTLAAARANDAATEQREMTPAEAACRVRTERDGLVMNVSGGSRTTEQIIGLLAGFAEPRLSWIDRTGLTGRFDLRLRFELFTPLQADASAEPRTGLPKLFEAAEDQLGLQFQIRGESADVMVIDAVQPPTAN
jgi:uncharacterized protein (TIGR03435 family)